MAILLTGGAGYIGSHTCVELIKSGYDLAVVDTLSNSCEESLKRVEKITGKPVKFYKADILDREALNEIVTDLREPHYDIVRDVYYRDPLQGPCTWMGCSK